MLKSRVSTHLVIPLFFLTLVLSCSTGKEPIDIQTISLALDGIDFENVLVTEKNEILISGGDVWNRGVLVTSQNGIDFSVNDSLTDKSIYGLLNTQNGPIGVGVGGYIITDLGKNNQFVRTSEWGFLRAIEQVEGGSFIAVGGRNIGEGVIARYDSIFQRDTSLVFSNECRDIACANPTDCFVAAFGQVFQTIDAGANWSLAEPTDDFFQAIDFDENGNGALVGLKGSLFITSDGGKNWISMKNGHYPTGRGTELLDVKIDGNQIVIAGTEGFISYSSDGGNSFCEFNTGTESDLRAVEFYESTIIAVGEEATLIVVTL